MNKLWFKSVVKSAKKAIHEHGPDILLGAGIAGVFLTVGEAIGATVKATDKIREYEADNDISVSELDPADRVTTVAKLVWRDYIPTTVSLAGTTAVLIMSGKKYRKQNAAIAAAYALLESDSNTYIKKLVERIGEEKAEEIRNELDQDIVQDTPAPTYMLPSADGSEPLVRCMEMSSKRYFWWTRREIEQAILDLNCAMMRDTYISLSEWYGAFNLEPTDISDGMYWDITTTGPIQYKIGSVVAKDGVPVLTVRFENKPIDRRW